MKRHFRMLRAKCRRCGRTHAVRCGMFKAYCRYSAAFIHEVLAVSGKAVGSIRRICAAAPLCPRTVSRWRASFRKPSPESPAAEAQDMGTTNPVI